MTQKLATTGYILEQLIGLTFQELNCIKIGTIEKFYQKTQTADVTIESIPKVRDDNDNIVQITYPTLLQCPVFILSGGSASIQMPIEKGDSCLILFNDVTFGNWWNSSSITQNIVNLKDNMLISEHNINSGIVLAGIHKKDNSITGYTDKGVQIVAEQITLGDDATNNVEIIGTHIKLGKNATQGVARVGDTVTGTYTGTDKSGNAIPPTPPISAKIKKGSDTVLADGKNIARQGDEVEIEVPGTVANATFTGTITKGSTKVFSE